jgi:hypothetical protein
MCIAVHVHSRIVEMRENKKRSIVEGEFGIPMSSPSGGLPYELSLVGQLQGDALHAQVSRRLEAHARETTELEVHERVFQRREFRSFQQIRFEID